jgi:hypothetical protein
MAIWTLEHLQEALAAARIKIDKRKESDVPAWVTEHKLQHKTQYGGLFVAIPVAYYIKDIYDPYYYDEYGDDEEDEPKDYTPMRWKPNKHKLITNTVWVCLEKPGFLELDSPYKHPHMTEGEYCMDAPGRFKPIHSYEDLMNIKAELEVALSGINLGSIFTPYNHWHPQVLKAIPEPIKKWYFRNGAYSHDKYTTEDVNELRTKIKELATGENERQTTWSTLP